ncbi:Methyltransferase domain-containing protein [Methanobrevibacter olleyae]|uniref:Methyltransferase domain-containing protein n=1 Tax=Methanobrevibacter olleyae TaxID=294671 RepID=A0A1I4HEA5_METOL|nr:class I SAM-dependent methyltransferase [Methanobrevibacter olleyae]SFL40080.1 Methyltransferase domain-containing protein [Methanobrevibacter olleyae]
MDIKGDRGKDWSKAAIKYSERASEDNYTEQLISKMILSSEDTLLDVGCGEGSLTIPLSKEVSSITAIDTTDKILEILDEKIKENNIKNIKTIKDDVNDLTLEKYGKYDIVLASRVINSIKSPKKVFSNLNEIANKYVFITIFGPNNWKLEKDFFKYINKEYNGAPSYIILLNLLAEMEIYPNVVNLDVGPIRTYENIEEAIDNGKWNLEKFTKYEQELLAKYLESILMENEEGLLTNPNDKPDWVLIWWKK